MKKSKILFATIFLLVGVGMMYLGFGFFQDARELSAMEPVPAGELGSQEGEVILEGVARPAEDSSLLETKYRGEEAIAHEWEVEREEIRTTTTGDSTTTRTEWVTVDSGQGSVDFYVEDDSGKAPVNTETVSVNLDTQTVRQDGDRRYSEGALEPGEEVFVRGTVTTEDGETQVGTGDGVDEVVVRDGDKEEAVFSKYVGAGFLTLFGVIFSLVALVVIRGSVKEGS